MPGGLSPCPANLSNYRPPSRAASSRTCAFSLQPNPIKRDEIAGRPISREKEISGYNRIHTQMWP